MIGSKYTEGLYHGGWTVHTRYDISNQTQVHVTIGAAARVVYIDTDSEISVLFDNVATTDNSADNDIRYAAGHHAIPVPFKLKEGGTAFTNKTIYMHVRQVASAATKYMRVVEF